MYENKKTQLHPSVEKTNCVSVNDLRLTRIKRGSVSQTEEGEKDPSVPEAVPGSGTDKAFAGIVLDLGDGTYRLLDGYHRVASIEKNGSQKSSGHFIVLGAHKKSIYSSVDLTDWDFH